jgi:hypothetical protein
MGIKLDRVQSRRGPRTFQIHGTLYHVEGPSEPDEGRPPTFAQIYFYDLNEAVNHRMGLEIGQGLDRDTDSAIMLPSPV